jgi:ATP-dependent Clp protease ATP-binding subunit ClpA
MLFRLFTLILFLGGAVEAQKPPRKRPNAQGCPQLLHTPETLSVTLGEGFDSLVSSQTALTRAELDEQEMRNEYLKLQLREYGDLDDQLELGTRVAQEAYLLVYQDSEAVHLAHIQSTRRQRFTSFLGMGTYKKHWLFREKGGKGTVLFAVLIFSQKDGYSLHLVNADNESDSSFNVTRISLGRSEPRLVAAPYAKGGERFVLLGQRGFLSVDMGARPGNKKPFVYWCETKGPLRSAEFKKMGKFHYLLLSEGPARGSRSPVTHVVPDQSWPVALVLDLDKQERIGWTDTSKLAHLSARTPSRATSPENDSRQGPLLAIQWRELMIGQKAVTVFASTHPSLSIEKSIVVYSHEVKANISPPVARFGTPESKEGDLRMHLNAIRQVTSNSHGAVYKLEYSKGTKTVPIIVAAYAHPESTHDALVVPWGKVEAIYRKSKDSLAVAISRNEPRTEGDSEQSFSSDFLTVFISPPSSKSRAHEGELSRVALIHLDPSRLRVTKALTDAMILRKRVASDRRAPETPEFWAFKLESTAKRGTTFEKQSTKTNPLFLLVHKRTGSGVLVPGFQSWQSTRDGKNLIVLGALKTQVGEAVATRGVVVVGDEFRFSGAGAPMSQRGAFINSAGLTAFNKVRLAGSFDSAARKESARAWGLILPQVAPELTVHFEPEASYNTDYSEDAKDGSSTSDRALRSGVPFVLDSSTDVARPGLTQLEYNPGSRSWIARFPTEPLSSHFSEVAYFFTPQSPDNGAKGEKKDPSNQILIGSSLFPLNSLALFGPTSAIVSNSRFLCLAGKYATGGSKLFANSGAATAADDNKTSVLCVADTGKFARIEVPGLITHLSTSNGNLTGMGLLQHLGTEVPIKFGVSLESKLEGAGHSAPTLSAVEKGVLQAVWQETFGEWEETPLDNPYGGVDWLLFNPKSKPLAQLQILGKQYRFWTSDRLGSHPPFLVLEDVKLGTRKRIDVGIRRASKDVDNLLLRYLREVSGLVITETVHDPNESNFRSATTFADSPNLLFLETERDVNGVANTYILDANRQWETVISIPNYCGYLDQGVHRFYVGSGGIGQHTIVAHFHRETGKFLGFYDLGTLRINLDAKDPSIALNAEKSQIVFRMSNGSRRYFDMTKGGFLGMLPSDDSFQDLLARMEAEIGPVLNERLFATPPTPISFRQEEVEEVARSLGFHRMAGTVEKPALIVAEHGAGSSAILNEAISRYLSGEYPNARQFAFVNFSMRTVMGQDHTMFVGGTERAFNAVNEFARELAARGFQLVLVVDNIESVLVDESDWTNSSDRSARQYFKELLANDAIKVVATTTPDGYAAIQREASDVSGTFQHLVRINSMDIEKTQSAAIQLAQNLLPPGAPRLFEEEELKRFIVHLEKISHGRSNPGSTIDLLKPLIHDRASEYLRTQKLTPIGKSDFIKILHAHTRIPIRLLDKNTRDAELRRIETSVTSKVLGEVPKTAAREVLRYLSAALEGRSQPGRMIYKGLFPGPTGVGKTSLVEAIAEGIFDEPYPPALLVLNGDEFSSAIQGASALLHKRVGEHVRQHPFSIVLFDEIEKVDPQVRTVILSMLGGTFTDGKGKRINMDSVIFFATTNIGSKEAERAATGMGLAATHNVEGTTLLQRTRSPAADREFYLKALEKEFPPEQRGRFDAIQVFESLTEAQSIAITENFLNSLDNRRSLRSILRNGPDKVEVQFDQTVVEWARTSFRSYDYGARGWVQQIYKAVHIEFLNPWLNENRGHIEGKRLRVTYDSRSGFEVLIEDPSEED